MADFLFTQDKSKQKQTYWY